MPSQDKLSETQNISVSFSSRPSYKPIEKSPNDVKFREIVKKSVDSAKSEIIIIGGELESYDFPELKKAVQEARSRGVDVKIYVTNPPLERAHEWLSIGCEVYVGKERSKDHYLVIDKKMYIVSEKGRFEHTTRIGERRGRYYLNDPKGANRITNYFIKLISNANPNPVVTARAEYSPSETHSVSLKVTLLSASVMIGILYIAIMIANIPGETIAPLLVLFSVIIAWRESRK